MTALTAEEFARFPPDDHRTELIRGEVVTLPIPSFRHGKLALSIASALQHHVENAGVGIVLMGCGLILTRNPDSVLATDISVFLGESPVPIDEPDGWPERTPDFVVDLVDTFDNAVHIEQRTAIYRASGVGLIAVVDVNRLSATIYPSEHGAKIQRTSDVIDFDEVIPGCSVSLRTFTT